MYRAMLELNQILRANEINFAILAAFPAVIVTCFLGYFGKVLLIEVYPFYAPGSQRIYIREEDRMVINYHHVHLTTCSESSAVYYKF